MRLTGVYSFAAPVARVWDVLMNPSVISTCLPGCQKFEELAEDEYRVVMNATVAAIGGSFGGTVRIADKKPTQSYRLVFDGSGASGFAKGESLMTLRETPDGVDVEVDATVAVGGLVAQVGQRLLGTAAKMMMDRFFKCVTSKV